MENVFTLFYRASNIKHIPGHGVGLSITRQIMEYCQVDMHIQPASEQGTQVRLLF
jgi:K+-sensing histidine kinase KdpD